MRTPKLLSLLTVAAVSLCLLGLTGCGPGGSKVKGTLVLPAGVTLKDNDSVAVQFIPDGGTGGAGMASYDPKDKSFIAKAPDGGGVAPGKYKISVQLTPYPGDTDGAARAATFAPINSQYNAANTKLTYEVTSDSNQNIEVDLDKGTVTKK